MYRFSLFAFVLCSGTASANCSIAEFDRSAPGAVRDIAQGSQTNFEWASDADPSPDGDGMRAWHYIRNLHEEDLSLIWEKPDALIPFNQPLGKDEISCFYKYGDVFTVDRDAPITTTSEGTKQAKAYIPSGPSQKTGAEVGREGDGIVGRIRAILRYFSDDNVLVMQLSSSSSDVGFLIGTGGTGIPAEVFAGQVFETVGSSPRFTDSIEAFAETGDFGLEFLESDPSGPVATFRFAGDIEMVFSEFVDLAPTKIPIAITNADGQILSATKIDLQPLIPN